MNDTMSVSGEIVEEVVSDIFRVKTKLGDALVWFDEELYLAIKPGLKFEVTDGPIIFWDGQVISNITKNVLFWLDGRRYEIHEPEHG